MSRLGFSYHYRRMMEAFARMEQESARILAQKAAWDVFLRAIISLMKICSENRYLAKLRFLMSCVVSCEMKSVSPRKREYKTLIFGARKSIEVPDVRKTNSEILTIVRFLPLLLALFSSPSYASDWKEYAIVCDSRGSIIVATKDGRQELKKSENENAVIIKINEMIEDGWQPLRGVASSIEILCQAMGKD